MDASRVAAGAGRVGIVRAIPLQCWVLVSAALLWLLFGRRERVRLPMFAHEHTTFVCIVGVSARVLRSLASEVRSVSAYPNAVTFGLVAVVGDASQVSHDTDHWEGLTGTTVLHHYAADAQVALMDARRVAMERLYGGERHVLFLYGSKPLPGWDDLCVRLLEASNAPDTIVVSAPSNNEHGVPRATFPCLTKTDDATTVSITCRTMATTRPVLTASTTWLRAFSYVSRDALRACGADAWHDGQMEQTVAWHARGVAIAASATPVCERASRCGVGVRAAPTKVASDDAAFGDHPHVGIYDDADDEEAILKYGDVDTARIVIQQRRTR